MNEKVNIPDHIAGGTRRSFLKSVGLGVAALSFTTSTTRAAEEPGKVQGFELEKDGDASKGWKPFSDRKIRVGLVGYGYCKFSATFSFQDHPNVEVYAVSDLLPDRCAALAERTKCSRTYPSIEEMVKDDKIEAIFVATDAPSHAQHCALVLAHGKHVCTAVPAVWGSLEDAEMLFKAVKSSGLKYMMFETSAFHKDLHAMRQIYRAGGFGEIVYAEGEYMHYMPTGLESFKGWRLGLPPLWYPTHATAYPLAITGGSFTEVSCQGVRSAQPLYQAKNNRYKNPFGHETAIFRTNTGGTTRTIGSWDTPGFGAEAGRVRGSKGSFAGRYEGLVTKFPDLKRPPLPPTVEAGFHGGSHGYLMNEFVEAVIQDRKPLVDIAMALNLTVPGIVAHQSALKDGELMKIPQYRI